MHCTLAPQTAIYLMPSPGAAAEAVLFPGVVVRAAEGGLLIAPSTPLPTPATNELTVFFESGGRFLKQPGEVAAAPAGNSISPPENAELLFRPRGEATSAQRRSMHRVCTAMAGLTARVGAERRCPVLDLCGQGVCVSMAKAPRRGTILQLTLEHAGEVVVSRARVQTVYDAGDGRFRCGLLVPASEGKARRALQTMTAALQRAQLRKLRQSA